LICIKASDLSLPVHINQPLELVSCDAQYSCFRISSR
jgi:hypothetical protein